MVTLAQAQETTAPGSSAPAPTNVQTPAAPVEAPANTVAPAVETQPAAPANTVAPATEAPPAAELAPEIETPAGPLDTDGIEAADDHGSDELHATTEAHGGEEHSDVFPPFDPATFPSQLLWLALTFGFLYVVMSRMALPRLGSVLDERKARVDGDLAAAEADRQKTDAAIAAYESALANARSRAQAIANETRDANLAEANAARQAEEAKLSERVAAAEAQIAQTKAAALSHIDEIAAETAQAVVNQLIGSASWDAARSAVNKVKE
jgi:F-type H+-transporting ATPase subunit b